MICESELEEAEKLMIRLLEYGGLRYKNMASGERILVKVINNEVNTGLRPDLVLAVCMLRKYLGMI